MSQMGWVVYTCILINLYMYHPHENVSLLAYTIFAILQLNACALKVCHMICLDYLKLQRAVLASRVCCRCTEAFPWKARKNCLSKRKFVQGFVFFSIGGFYAIWHFKSALVCPAYLSWPCVH